MKLAHQTISNSIGSVAGFLTLTITVFLITPYTLHQLGTDQYGVYALFFSLIGLLSFVDFGLGYTSIRFIADALIKEDHDLIRRIINLNIIFFLFIGAGLLVITSIFLHPFIALLNVPAYLVEQTEFCIILTVISLPISLIMGVFSSVLQAYQRYVLLNLALIIDSIIFTALTAITLYFNPSIIWLMVLNLGNALTLLLFYFIITKRLTPQYRFRFEFDTAIFRKLFNFSAHTLIIIVAMRVLFQIDRFFISRSFGSAAVTPYALANSISSKIHGIASNLNNVLFPLSTTLYSKNDQAGLIALYQKSRRFTYIILMAMGIPLIIYADLIIKLWLGEQYVYPSALLLQLGVIGMILFCCSIIPASFLAGFNKQKESMYFNSIIAISNVLALIVLVPRWQLFGAAWALIIAQWSIPIMILYVERLLRISWLEQLNIYFRLAVVGGLSVVVMWVSSYYIHNLIILLIALLSSGLFVLIVSYLIVLHAEDRLIIVSYLKKLFYKKVD